MFECSLNIKSVSDLDRLSISDLDNFIDHSYYCEAHAIILERFENSVLPVLRASLPDIVIHGAPRIEDSSGDLERPLRKIKNPLEGQRLKPIWRDLRSYLSSVAAENWFTFASVFLLLLPVAVRVYLEFFTIDLGGLKPLPMWNPRVFPPVENFPEICFQAALIAIGSYSVLFCLACYREILDRVYTGFKSA